MNHEQWQSPENKNKIAQNSFGELVRLLYKVEQANIVDLNQNGEWRTEKVTDKYLIERRSLPVDEIRHLSRTLRDFIEFLDPDYRKDAEGLLIRADIYLAGHDEKEEARQKESKSIVFSANKNLSYSEVLEYIKKEDMGPLSPRQLLDLQLQLGFITQKEYNEAIAEYEDFNKNA